MDAAFRHKSLDYFYARPLPTWGGNLAEIDFENIYYYIRPTEKQVDKWEDLPAEILDTWDKLGIPRPRRSTSPGSGPSTSRRSSTTSSRRTWRPRA